MNWEWYNDLHMIPTYILGLVVYLFILFIAVLFHEAGHMLYFKLNKIKVKSEWLFFKNGTWIGNHITADVDNHQHLMALWCGVLIGLIPIVISCFVFFPVFLLVVPYGYIIKGDLKGINDNLKFEDE